MREFIERWLWVLAVAMAAGAIFYVAWTVTAHNATLECIHQTFNQLLLELEHHHHLTGPPPCS